MNTHVHEKIKDFMNHGLNDHVCRKNDSNELRKGVKRRP